MATPTLKRAVQLIEKHGILLVFPIDNRQIPLSLWSLFYPESPMVWKWDDTGDARVASLWHLREQLAQSRKVVYGKWFRGRATFFSREVFAALLSSFREMPSPLKVQEAQLVLELLEENSPLSTKALKRAARLEGRFHEGMYQKALKELWSRLLIVGVGEVDDGAFPSLSIGATQWMFEELWQQANTLTTEERERILLAAMNESSPFRSQYLKLRGAYSRQGMVSG